MTVSEDRAFKEVIELDEAVRMALIQYDLCPHKKRKFGHIERHQELAHIGKRTCEATESGTRRNQPCQQAGLGLPAPGL